MPRGIRWTRLVKSSEMKMSVSLVDLFVSYAAT